MSRKKRKKFDVIQWKIYFLFGGVLLCLYIFLSSKIIDIGYKIEKLESRYHDALLINQNYQAGLLRICGQESLKELMKKHNITLKYPSTWSFVDVKIKKDALRTGLINGKAEANTR